jgi:hypothetical protein
MGKEREREAEPFWGRKGNDCKQSLMSIFWSIIE